MTKCNASNFIIGPNVFFTHFSIFFSHQPLECATTYKAFRNKRSALFFCVSLKPTPNSSLRTRLEFTPHLNIGPWQQFWSFRGEKKEKESWFNILPRQIAFRVKSVITAWRDGDVSSCLARIHWIHTFAKEPFNTDDVYKTSTHLHLPWQT